MTSWTPILRLASRDARRHLLRTICASLLIALPVAGLTAFISVSNPGLPARDRVLASIPQGAQAVITATALPRGNEPFAQLPEGAPGPWIDDFETVPASEEEVQSVLSPGTTLAEYWLSPPLVASPNLPLAAGEQHRVSDHADQLGGTDLERLAMVELRESEAASFELQAPEAIQGAAPQDANEVLISSAVADRLSLQVGDTLGFVAPPDSGVRSTDGNAMAAMQDSARGYRVSGIADSDQYVAWSHSGWLSKLVADSPEGVQRHWLALGADPVTWAQARALNELQVFAISRDVLENYPAAADLYPVALDPAVVVEGVVGVVLALTGGALLVMFLVTPALAISAEQSRRTLGLAAAAGAAPRDLRRMVLTQGLVLGFWGGVIGSLLGFAAALGFGGWLGGIEADSRYGFENALTHFPWWASLAGFVIAVVLGAIAAIGPAVSAAKLAPVDAMRDRAPASRGRKRQRVSLVLGVSFLLLSVAVGVIGLLLPAPSYPTGAEASQYMSPQALPPGSALLVVTVVVTVLAAAIGLVLLVRGLVPLLGRIGRRSRPSWRLALRDTADHPSRTVPAILGVVFSLAAASYLIVVGASARADYRASEESIDWQGTFVLSPNVQVDPDFDRAIAEAMLDEVALEVPGIIGSFPVEAVSMDSSWWIEPLLPEGQGCAIEQEVSVASAREVGAPVVCVNSLSGAAFHASIRFGSVYSTWQPPVLMTGEALRATRLPGADEAAQIIDAGGVLTSNAAYIDQDGMIRLVAGPLDSDAASLVRPEMEVLLPAGFLRGMGVGLVMSAETARSLGVDSIAFAGLLAQTAQPIAASTLSGLWQMDIGNLAAVFTPDSTDALSPSLDIVSMTLSWAPSVLLALIAVAAAGLSVLLSASQSRRDSATAYAVGAPRSTLIRWALARAAVILGIGIPLGMGVGIALGAYQVAWNRNLQASGAWLDTVFVWPAQGVIAIIVALVGLLAAVALSRPPRNLVRRSLD